MEQTGERTPEMAMRWKHETKQLPCKYCGVGITVGVRTRKLPKHLECGLQAAAQNMRELQQHSGPYYERWRNSVIEYWGRQSPTTPPPIERGTPPAKS